MFSESDSNFENKGQNLKSFSNIAILLKTFYGWYTDRTAEGEAFRTQQRTVNDTTPPEAENIVISYRRILLSENEEPDSSSVWELFIKYPGYKEPQIVPVAVIDGNLYLNFQIKLPVSSELPDSEEEKDPLEGFWCGIGEADGIKVSQCHVKDSIESLYITRKAVYQIRYWKTDMEYTSENAFFSDGPDNFSVVKHIQSAGRIYTCVQGRSVTIRNVEKSNIRPQEYTLDKSGRICAFGKPYLKRIQDENTVEKIMAIVKENNARHAPDPDPPFPPSNLDWHMEEIYRLEKGNVLVEEVRKRQKAFQEGLNSSK